MFRDYGMFKVGYVILKLEYNSEYPTLKNIIDNNPFPELSGIEINRIITQMREAGQLATKLHPSSFSSKKATLYYQLKFPSNTTEFAKLQGWLRITKEFLK